MHLLNMIKKMKSELLETLEVLVNNLGARNVTANALHLHRNTLIYRIKKIENQTGYDLSDPNSILEIALALRIKKFEIKDAFSGHLLFQNSMYLLRERIQFLEMIH